MSPHFFIVAGEPSGDAHAARLMQALRTLFPSCRFSGIGGVAMEREGLQSLVSLEGISVVGFWEVAKSIQCFGHYSKNVHHTLLPAILICLFLLITRALISD